MEIFFIIILILALIIISAVWSAKNKIKNINKENFYKSTNYDQTNLNNMKITNNDDFIKIKKINIQMIIAGAVVTIALVLIYKEYKEYRQEQEAIKMLNALGKELEPYNESMKKSLKTIDKMNDELYKQLDKMNKK